MNEKQLPVAERADQQEIQLVQPSMITPAATIEETIEQFNLYQQLKKRLADKNDFQNIKGKPHPKKSFVRKVQRFFNISCEILNEKPLKDENGELLAWIVTTRATHLATGAYQDGDGACDFEEKRSKRQPSTIHNVRAHAVTRAKNRAILDLVGFGDVSAEEIPQSDYDNNKQPQQPSNQGNPKSEPQPEPEPVPTKAKAETIDELKRKAEQIGKLDYIKSYVRGKTDKEIDDLTQKEAEILITSLNKQIKQRKQQEQQEPQADGKKVNLKKYFNDIAEFKLSNAEQKELVLAKFGKTSRKDLTPAEADELIKELRELKEQKNQDMSKDALMANIKQHTDAWNGRIGQH